MALGGIYETGTVTIAVDRVSATGSGTFWSPIVEVGDWIFIGGQVGLVGAVVDDTHLTLETQWVGTLPSAAAYVIIKMSWLRYDPALTQSKVRQLLEELHAQGNFLFVEGDEPDDAMGEDGQWALKTNATPWQLWLKVDGVWVQQAPPAGIRWRGAWGSAITYSAADGVQYLGSSYISKTENTNQPPNTNPDDWDLMAAKGDTGSTGGVGPPSIVWRGAWSSSTTYAINDAVSDAGSSYIAVAGNINSHPPNANWNVLASGGTLADSSVDPIKLNADTAAEQVAFRVRLDAAPFDAMAYNGMQINGSMEVSQELGTTGVTASNAYACDGWVFNKTGTMAGTAAQAPPLATGYIAGFPSVLFVTVTTAQTTIGASDLINVSQKIEGYRIARLGWGGTGARPLTIGFWVSIQRPGTYCVSVRNSAANRSYVATYTHAGSSAYEYKTITIPGCTDGVWNIDNTIGMYINFSMACGTTYHGASANTWLTTNSLVVASQVNGVAATSDVFRITGVVVLPGTQSPTAAQSSQVMRPYDQELVTCRRYYRHYGGTEVNEALASGQCYSTTAAQVIQYLEVPMRTTPAITWSGAMAIAKADTSGAGLASIVVAQATNVFFALNCTVVSGLVAGDATKLQALSDITARLKIDARL